MIKRIFAALSVTMLLASCASEAPALITDKMYDEFFTNWVKKNAPHANELESGIFMEYIHKSNTTDTTTIKPRISMVYFSYTFKTLEGSIFATRDSSLIRQLGTWRNNTHFVDAYQMLGTTDSYMKLCVGAQYGMTKLKTGDHARFYIPPMAAYYDNEMAINSGYKGSSVTYLKRPIIFEVRIDKIVDNPVKFERDSVEKWASKNWNIRIKDTIFEGIYLKTISPAPDTASMILKDQEIKIDWTEYFTDYFILNTNVDSIAKRYNIYSSTSQYSPLSITAGNTTSSEIDQAVLKAVLKMKRGQKAEILSLSKWTLKGNQGSASNIPQIEAYQPRIFRIRIYTKEEEKALENK